MTRFHNHQATQNSTISPAVQQQLLKSLKRKTAANYLSIFRNYCNFCMTIEVYPLPLSYYKLSEYYLDYCRQDQDQDPPRTARSLKTIQAALKKIQILSGLNEVDPTITNRLNRLIQSLEKTDEVPVAQKIVVTNELLQQAHDRITFTHMKEIVFFTLMFVGHDGLFRIAELLKFTFDDIQWLNSDTITFRIQRSKMNQTIRPEYMTITQYAAFSAVAFLKRYLRCLQPEEKQGLLFKLPDTPHSRRKITQFCQAVFEMPHHKRRFSFREGRATDIFNLSHDEILVRHLGRWKSEAYLIYVIVE